MVEDVAFLLPEDLINWIEIPTPNLDNSFYLMHKHIIPLLEKLFLLVNMVNGHSYVLIL